MEQCTRQLCSVKHQIYHPRLPTLRRMDMDTMLQRLTNEHSRHTTDCSTTHFVNSKSTYHTNDSSSVKCKNVARAETVKSIEIYKPLWRSGVKNQKHFVAHNGHTKECDKINMNGLIQRKKHPDITSSWRIAMEVKGQTRQNRPTSASLIPATMYCRYRNTSRPYSAYPWY